MALIIMCCYDTEENGRSEYTRRTLQCLCETVNWQKHSIVVVDNNSCEETKKEISFIKELGTLITLKENVGTAKAVNLGIKLRKEGEYVLKVDNDVVIHKSGWVDELEEAIEREPTIGVLGLKRKDLRQTPYDPDPNFKSELIQLPHESGQKWITVERTNDIMGTCTMLNWRLLDKIGYYHQPGKYGFDDTLMNLRSLLAGFINCFLPHINMDHIDAGGNDYVNVKQQQAGAVWDDYRHMHDDYVNGVLPLYYDGGFE